MPSHSKYPWLLSAVILAAVLIAYIPAINGGFIWDDDDYVTENPVLRDMAGLGRIWTERSSLPQW